jgi:hypothetical protein
LAAVSDGEMLMTDDPDNSHVMPMLALHVGGRLLSVMGAVSLYRTVVNGMRVRDRSSAGYWSLFETLQLEGGLFVVGILLAWLAHRRPRAQ